jgi:hypothetical protein
MRRIRAIDANVPKGFRVFLAGGITNCPEWSDVVAKRLQDLPDDLVLLDPRRIAWPIDDPSATDAQITWEHQMFRKAHLISFWFACQTLCPIVLYKLGYWTGQSTDLIVGIHPKYPRRRDVEIQTRLTMGTHTRLIYSLVSLEAEIRESYWQWAERMQGG